MANDAEMPERIARIIRENLSGVTSTDPDIRAAQEDDLMRTAELIAADLCASGQQVRALALLEAARFIETMEQVVPPEPMTAEMLKAVAGAGLRYMAKRLAPLTPAPQPEGMECPRCASVGGFGCYECTPPQPSEMIAAVERAFDEIRELNMSGRDENGHRWANSDLIDQTVTEGLVALRALKGSDNG